MLQNTHTLCERYQESAQREGREGTISKPQNEASGGTDPTDNLILDFWPPEPLGKALSRCPPWHPARQPEQTNMRLSTYWEERRAPQRRDRPGAAPECSSSHLPHLCIPKAGLQVHLQVGWAQGTEQGPGQGKLSQ